MNRSSKTILHLCLAAGLGTLLGTVVLRTNNNWDGSGLGSGERVGLNLLAQQLEEVAEQTAVYHTVIVDITARQKVLYVLPGQELRTWVKVLCRVGTTNWSIHPEVKTIQLTNPSVLANGCQIDETATKPLSYSRGVEVLADGLEISQKSRLAALEEAKRLASEPRVLDAAKRQLEAGLAPLVGDGWTISYVDLAITKP